MKKHLIAVAALSVVLTSAAHGMVMEDGLLRIETNETSLASSLPTDGRHDVSWTIGADGWYNANLYATENVKLTYEFLGFEAGWTNTFLADDEQVFWNKGYAGNSASMSTTSASSGDTADSSAAADSLLDFAFSVLVGGNAGKLVENGANNYPISDISDSSTYYADSQLGMLNFFLGYASDDHDSVYIAFDDGGGRPFTNTSIDDDNHDDMVIKVTAVAVPEPESLFLFGLGLLGLGLARYRSSHSG